MIGDPAGTAGNPAPLDPRTGRPLDPTAMVTVADLYEPAFRWAIELGAVVATQCVVMSGGSCDAYEHVAVTEFAQAGSAAGHLPIGPPDVGHVHDDDPLTLAAYLEALAGPCDCGNPACPGPAVDADELAAIRTALDAAAGTVLVVVRSVIIPHVYPPRLARPDVGAPGPLRRGHLLERRQ